MGQLEAAAAQWDRVMVIAKDPKIVEAARRNSQSARERAAK